MDLDFLLIRKMKLGDEEAFDVFIHKYYQDVLAYCTYHCIDQEYAADLTQETFLHFFTRLSKYHHRGKVKNFLYTIAHNLCIDYWKKTREIPVEKEWMEQGESKNQDIDIILDKIAVQSALKEIPKELGEVIVLYYLEGLKIKEISEKLEITVPLVKYRLKRAKMALKNLL